MTTQVGKDVFYVSTPLPKPQLLSFPLLSLPRRRAILINELIFDRFHESRVLNWPIDRRLKCGLILYVYASSSNQYTGLDISHEHTESMDGNATLTLDTSVTQFGGK